MAISKDEKSLAEKTTTARYRQACRLSEAWRELGSAELREQLDPRNVTASNSEELPSDASGWLKAKAFGLDLTEAVFRNRRAVQALKADLLRRVQTGELDALGYRVAPTKSHEPVIIERSEFEKYEPMWSEESLEFRDFIYRDIKIALPIPPERRKPMGRPTRRPEIEAAIRDLISEMGPAFCNLNRKEAVELVKRQILGDKYVKGATERGLNSKTIEAIILRICSK